MRSTRKEWVLDFYNLGLGVFLFASPRLFAMARETARFNIWMTGLLLLVVSVAAIVAFREWEEWIRLLVALWMIVAPFVLGFTHTAGMHVSIAIGCVVLFLTLLELFLLHDEQPRSRTTAAH